MKTVAENLDARANLVEEGGEGMEAVAPVVAKIVRRNHQFLLVI